MATTHMSADMSKPSFAKVAASMSKDTSSSKARRVATPSKDQNNNPTISPAPVGPIIAHSTPERALSSPANVLSQHANPLKAIGVDASVDKAILPLNDLSLGTRTPSLVVNGSGSTLGDRFRPTLTRELGSDDSQRADSSSELGTKPPSLDGKSITSGTTFALDEKESLRPDDSASVKAAAEDDDAFSIRGSLIAGSRMGSDLAARARGIQLGDIPERRLGQQPVVGIHPQGILTPQSASSEQPPPSMPLGSEAGSSDALNVIYRQAPDEKLLEALASPRDRMFLLRLEKDVIEFVQDSKEPYMDLPPSNSFCRMLTHKLADYYHMTHSYEPHIGSVRIFRTPFCRVPPSLALMSPPTNDSEGETPPPVPVILPKKIMRRGQEGEVGPVSSGASKATSEDGSDSKDKPHSSSQKLTREEREELYKLARERIFGSSEEAVSDNTGDNELSRASSVSTNNMSTVGKRGKSSKQRRDDSDSFDSRNQYTPYWGPQQQTWVSQQQPQAQLMAPPAGPYNGQIPTTYPAQMIPPYTTQNPQPYPPAPSMAPNASYQGYPLPQGPQIPQVPQYAPQPAPQRFQPGGSPMAAYGAPLPPVAPPQGWQPGFNPAAYQHRGPPVPTGPPGPPGPPGPSGVHTHNGIPYAFGQLPANANPSDPKSQHPIPGSYNRNHAFNPKTQSFVPGGNTMPPVQAPQPPYTAPGSHHGSPQIGAPHLVYSGYQQPIPQPYGGGFGMARQGSNNSMHGYHLQQPHVTPPHSQHGPPIPNPNQPPVHHIPQNPSAHIPARPSIPQGPNQMFSHLPTYGNPATLPQKPATGI